MELYLENALIDNSLAENVTIDVLSTALGGETAKLTFSGSYPLDWTYKLNILKHRTNNPKRVMLV